MTSTRIPARLRTLALAVPIVALAACETPPAAVSPTPPPATSAAVVTAAPTAAPTGTTAQAAGRLGTTIASLGDATQGGFWIKTPLVNQPGKGRIVYRGTGKSVDVDLIPLPGPATAGSQVSLPALTTLGVSLTDLPEIEVFRI